MHILSRGVARFSLWLALCLAMPFTAGAARQASAQPAEGSAEALPAGEWSGVLAHDTQSLVAVRLLQRSGGAMLLFGSPLRCAAQVNPQPDGSFALESVKGYASCDQSIGKSLRVQRSGDDLRLNVDGRDLPVVLHANPAQPSPIKGKWWGWVKIDSGLVAQLLVSISETPQPPDGAMVHLHYGAEPRCLVRGHYVGTRKGTALYSLDFANGGYCARLRDGQLTLRARSAERVELEVTDDTGRHKQTAVLEPAIVSR